MKIIRFGFWGLSFCLIFTISVMVQSHLDDSKVIRKVKVPAPHRVVALTFDDGPHPDSTPKLLEVLRQKEVKATMFVLGQNVEKHPELVAQMVADGHEIGLHSYSHPIFSKVSLQERTRQFELAERAVEKIAPKPTLFRPPGGGYNNRVVEEALNRGYKTILWSVDTRDWSRPGADSIINTVLKEVKPGSIVLMHDGQRDLQTAAAVSVIADRLRAEGYSFVPVGELLEYGEGPN